MLTVVLSTSVDTFSIPAANCACSLRPLMAAASSGAEMSAIFVPSSVMLRPVLWISFATRFCVFACSDSCVLAFWSTGVN